METERTRSKDDCESKIVKSITLPGAHSAFTEDQLRRNASSLA